MADTSLGTHRPIARRTPDYYTGALAQRPFRWASSSFSGYVVSNRHHPPDRCCAVGLRFAELADFPNTILHDPDVDCCCRKSAHRCPDHREMGPVGRDFPSCRATSFAFLPVIDPRSGWTGHCGLAGLDDRRDDRRDFQHFPWDFIGKLRFALPPLGHRLIVTDDRFGTVKRRHSVCSRCVPLMGQTGIHRWRCGPPAWS